MKTLKTVACGAALAIAAGLGGIGSPAAFAQTQVLRAQAPRSVEILTGASRIGVSVRDIEDGDGKAMKGDLAGVMVDDVSTGSAAEKAGIKKGDLVVEFDGERVRSVRQLTRLVRETPSGRTVQAAIVRDGQRSTVSITPSDGGGFRFEGFDEIADMARDFRYRVAPRPPAPPASPGRPARPAPPSEWNPEGLLGRSGSRLGISVSSLSPQLAEYFGTKGGVLVASVAEDSAAAKAGIKAGDVITSFDGSAVNDPAEVRRRAADLGDGAEFTIGVIRDKKPLTLKGKAERRETRRIYRTTL